MIKLSKENKKGIYMYNDRIFDEILKIVFGIEGDYVNDPDDKGGATNYGITQDTMNAWRKMNNLPQGSVKTDLTKKEARDIYYNMYWKESGADKHEDPRKAMVLFDTAVNSGPQEAKRLFRESNEDFDTMLSNRRKYYDNIILNNPKQEKFREGWYNRLKILEQNANKLNNMNFDLSLSSEEKSFLNNDYYTPRFPQTK